MFGVLLLSFNGHWYFLVFIDDFSNFTWLFPIKHKSEVYSIFLKFQRVVENNLSNQLNLYNLIEVGNNRICSNILSPVVFSIIYLVLIPMSKMAWQNENSNVYTFTMIIEHIVHIRSGKLIFILTQVYSKSRK